MLGPRLVFLETVGTLTTTIHHDRFIGDKHETSLMNGKLCITCNTTSKPYEVIRHACGVLHLLLPRAQTMARLDVRFPAVFQRPTLS